MTEMIQRPEGQNKTWAVDAAKGGVMLPKHFQNNPGALFIAAELADSLGIHRASVLSDIYVVDGRPTLSANLMASQVRRAGHKLRVQKRDGAVKATLIRSDDPDFAFESIWTMERAQKAGLAGKNVWKSYPEAMMRSRAISEVVREGASEVLSGLNYTPEDFDRRAGSKEATEFHQESETVSVEDLTGQAEPEPEPQADMDTGEIVDDAPEVLFEGEAP